MGNISVDPSFTADRVRFGHAWRDKSGGAHATIRLGEYAAVTADSAEEARAIAAACLEAAEAIEALPEQAEAGQ